MKRGPESDLERENKKPRLSKVDAHEVSTEVSPTEGVPQEILSYIISYLPAYQRVGSKVVNLVSKSWDKASVSYEAKNFSKKVEDIINSCQSEEDAIYILKDENIRKKLTLLELFKIVSFYPAMASELLNFLKEHQTTPSDLWRLGATHLTVAEQILSDERLLYKLKKDDLIRLICIHPQIVQEFFDEPEKLSTHKNLMLSFSDLVMIASISEENAAKILNNAELCKSLTGSDLALLGKNHLNIAMRILDEPDLCGRLDGEALALLSEEHATVARRILETERLYSLMDGEDLAEFGSHHLEIAQQFLKDVKLCKKMGNFLPILARKHLKVAELMIEDPALRAILKVEDIALVGSYHVSIAHRLLKDEKFLARLMVLQSSEKSSMLALLSAFDLELALQLLDNPVYRRCLDSWDLAMLGVNFEEVAMRILNDKALFSRLESKQLLSLGIKFPKAASKILETLGLSRGIHPYQLCALVEMGVDVAAKFETLRSKDLETKVEETKAIYSFIDSYLLSDELKQKAQAQK
ncbi:MAG: hypothetical protein JSR17_02175 [Proteobacteria bacterium]|nr:hypothetical protein [Pseudomonadota bacterium]